jgi:thymidylate kinase
VTPRKSRKAATVVAAALGGDELRESSENDHSALIAIDGAHGPDVVRAATRLHQRLSAKHVDCVISKWDASGLFSDVASARESIRDVSPRTLLLLYAADLAFRLRWEIGPALEQGVVVVVAPYITTPVTFGLANGLSSDWLRTLLRFAPPADRTAVLDDRNPQRAWKRQPERGFCECCTTLLEATPEGFARRKTRRMMIDALSTAAEKHSGLVSKRDLKRLAARLIAEERAHTGRGRRSSS